MNDLLTALYAAQQLADDEFAAAMTEWDAADPSESDARFDRAAIISAYLHRALRVAEGGAR